MKRDISAPFFAAECIPCAGGSSPEELSEVPMSRNVLAFFAIAGSVLAQSGYVLPGGFDTVEGSRNNVVPFGNTPHRYQQVLPGADLPVPAVDIRGVAARPEDGAAATGMTVEVEVLLSVTPKDFQTMSANFDDNYGSAPVVVFAKKHLELPSFSAAPGPRTFDVMIHLDRPFRFAAAAGNLLLEVRVHGNANANRAFNYPMDAVWNGREPVPARTTRVYSANGPEDRSGTVGSGYGLVWMLMTSAPATAYRFGSGCTASSGVPVISASGAPRLGSNLRIHLTSAPANAPAVLWLGPTRDSFRGVRLPIDLTPIGAGGCTLLVGGVDFQAVRTDGSGGASTPIVIPADPRLADGRFFAQWLVIEPSANPAGLVASAGLEAAMR
jgi:hypothetical protein